MERGLHRAEKGVYFYFHEGRLSPFSYTAECLAQGLKALDIPVFSNITSPLFINQSVHQPVASVYVFVVTDSTYTNDYVGQIQHYPAPFKVILDMGDDIQNHHFPQDIPALTTHGSRFLKIDGDRRPWAFGLSDPIITATADSLPWVEREPIVLRNFRPSFNQGVRHAMDLALLPWLERHFTVEQRLSEEQGAQPYTHITTRDTYNAHYHDHFHKLKTYCGCLAYGGHFFPNLARSHAYKHHPQLQKFTFLKDLVIQRWDSFRFWESLAAGCLTFHLDFALYGLDLPVMPEAWRHYIPIDLADTKGTVEHLLDIWPQAGDIAAAGREWALSHYGPRGVALRFLHLIGELP